MNFGKDYSSVIALYAFTIIYVAFVGNKYVTILLVVGLFLITLYIYNNVRRVLSDEKDQSVNTLLNKLDRTERESEDTYKRFLSLSKTLGSGVLMVTDEGKISFSNKDIENYFGIDLNNRDYKDTVEIKSLYKFINEAYLLEERIRKQIVFEDKYYDLISTPLFDEDMFAGCIILVSDITQLKTAEKYQKRFTADVSHELRTPLAAIKGFSEILLRDESMDPEDRKEFTGLIKKESDRMEIILNDLMIISKMDRLDYEPTLVEYSIKQVIDESVSVLEQKFIQKGLNRTVDVEECKLMIDNVKITQVVINIIKNAINYTDEGFISIKGYKSNNKYVIQISDSGIGIKEKDYEKIFKRFYRVDKARSRDTGGSGLGLSISKNVILKHGGTIDVQSEVNKGSTFTITLPIKK